MYEIIIKRLLDICLSLCALIVLSPILVICVIFGTIAMGGNPFFLQKRVGKNERIFYLIKFRSMSNKKDKEGNLLPDEIRLNTYGKFIRSTSVDELPELINILIGDMSIIGPRPLLVEYLPYYYFNEKKRHDVRPGLSGLAQVNGRNFLSWEEIFEYDVQYVNNISFMGDVKIILDTILGIFKSGNVADVSTLMTDENGELYVLVDGEKKKLHQPLNIERKGANHEE